MIKRTPDQRTPAHKANVEYNVLLHHSNIGPTRDDAMRPDSPGHPEPEAKDLCPGGEARVQGGPTSFVLNRVGKGNAKSSSFVDLETHPFAAIMKLCRSVSHPTLCCGSVDLGSCFVRHEKHPRHQH